MICSIIVIYLCHLLQTLSKDQVKKSEIDADDNELVTGIDKPEKTEYDSQ